jgi:hypothetical protein
MRWLSRGMMFSRDIRWSNTSIESVSRLRYTAFCIAWKIHLKLLVNVRTSGGPTHPSSPSAGCGIPPSVSPGQFYSIQILFYQLKSRFQVVKHFRMLVGGYRPYSPSKIKKKIARKITIFLTIFFSLNFFYNYFI